MMNFSQSLEQEFRMLIEQPHENFKPLLVHGTLTLIQAFLPGIDTQEISMKLLDKIKQFYGGSSNFPSMLITNSLCDTYQTIFETSSPNISTLAGALV